MTPTEIKAQLAAARQAVQEKQDHIAKLERQLEQAEKKPLPIEQVVVACKDEYDSGAVKRHFQVLGYFPLVKYVIGGGHRVSLNAQTWPTHTPEEFFAQYPVRLAREVGPPPEDGTKVWIVDVYSNPVRIINYVFGSSNSFELVKWYRGDYYLTEAEAQAEADRINALIDAHRKEATNG